MNCAKEMPQKTDNKTSTIENSATRAVCIKLANIGNNSMFYYATVTFRGYGHTYGPLFVLSYRDMIGIESYYSYQTLGAYRAGRAYISDATGTLTTETPLVSHIALWIRQPALHLPPREQQSEGRSLRRRLKRRPLCYYVVLVDHQKASGGSLQIICGKRQVIHGPLGDGNDHGIGGNQDLLFAAAHNLVVFIQNGFPEHRTFSGDADELLAVDKFRTVKIGVTSFSQAHQVHQL